MGCVTSFLILAHVLSPFMRVLAVMRVLDLRAFLICFLLLSSTSVTAECLLSEDKAQNALSVFKSISTLDSFTGKYSSGLKLEGIAESYTILHNYIALKYVPKNKEEGLFIVAFDRSSWEYYLFHGSGVTEPNQFYKGSIDLKECSLREEVSLLSVLVISAIASPKCVIVSE